MSERFSHLKYMMRQVVDSEFLRYANSVHDENQSLIWCNRAQEEQIKALKNKIIDLNNEISEHEREILTSIYSTNGWPDNSSDDSPDESVSILDSSKPDKKTNSNCCIIM